MYNRSNGPVVGATATEAFNFNENESFTCIFQVFCLRFKSFAENLKTSQKTYFPEHLSMAPSVCVETVLSKLLRLLFKDVLLRNHNRK